MAIAGLVCIIVAGLLIALVAFAGRRPEMVRRIGKAAVAGPIVALVLLMVGCILEAVATDGVSRVLAIIGAIAALALVGFSVGLLLLRLRGARVENVSVTRDGVMLIYNNTGPVTMRWEDLTSLEQIEPRDSLPGGIGYRIKKGSPSEKALPFSTRIMSKLARQSYDGLLAIPGGTRDIDPMLKKLRRYWREPGARRELPGSTGSMGAPPMIGDVSRMTGGMGGARQSSAGPRQAGGPGPRRRG